MFLGQGSYSNQKVFQYDERSHDMIRSDRKKIIFVKSLMGKKLDSFFFYTKKKSVTGLGIFRRSDQKIFQYDERSHDMIRSD